MLRLERGEERLLHEVLRDVRIAHLADGEVEKVIAVGLDPVFGDRVLIFGNGFVHTPVTFATSVPRCFLLVADLTKQLKTQAQIAQTIFRVEYSARREPVSWP